MNKDALKAFDGLDKISGRRIRLNQQVLQPRKKEYAEVIFFGDLHYGYPSCAIDKAKDMLDYCLKKKIYIHLMGDLIEASNKYSVGDAIYRQLNPQSQVEYIINLLTPLAKAKLITGMHAGNHENRIFKETGIDITKMIAKELDVNYLGLACWNLFRVAEYNYLVYSMHGSSGAKFGYTKLKAVSDISNSFNCDLITCGHVHQLADIAEQVQYVDLRDKTIKEKRKHVLLTGHYLDYDNSYAQGKGYPVSKLGSPKVKFFTEKRSIYISY